MGFLDSVFDDDGIVGRLGETLQDAGWFVGAPAAAAFDIAKAGIPGGDPAVQGAIKAVTTGFQRGTQLFLGDENNPDDPNDNDENLLSPTIKTGMDALEWVYDNALAQPINTANILTQRGIADVRGIEDGASPFDVMSAWERADEKTGGHDDKGASIGREWWYTLGGVFGDGTSLTSEGQQQLDEHSRMFDVQSGMVDATARLFLDPTIVVGKGAKALRVSKTVAALKPGEVGEKLAETSDGLFAGWGKRHDEAVKWLSEPGRTAPEMMAAFRGLGEALDGPATASVLEEANVALRTAGKSDEEVQRQLGLILRAGYADPDALKEIDDTAAFAKDALAAMRSSKDDLKTASQWATQYADRVTPDDIAEAAQELNLVKDLSLRGRDYFTSDEFIRLTDQRLKSVSRDLDAAEREAARQQRVRNLFLGTEDKAGVAGVLSDRPVLASAVGASLKGAEKRAARERGENVGLDFVFQSTAWNKGVKYVAPHIYLGQKAASSFGRMVQPRAIDVHDEKAPLALDAFLKQSRMDPETRLGLVSKLAAARTEVEKGRIVEEAIEGATGSLVRSFREGNPHFTDEMEKLVNIALQKEGAKDRSRLAAHTQMFTAHKTDEGARGDLRIDDDGIAKFYPLLETQLVNTFELPDLRKAEHVLRRHSNWMTDVAEWAKGNRAPDPNRVQEVARRVFDTTAEKFPGLEVRTSNRAQMVNDFVWKSEESAKLLLEGFNKLWKYGTLATRPLAYGMRVNIDSGMRMAAALGPAAWMMHSAPRTFGFMTVGTASGAKMWFKSHADKLRQDELVVNLERIEDAWAAETGQAIKQGDDALYDAMKAEHGDISARLDKYRTGGRQGRRRAYGAFGEAGYKDIKTRAGELAGAFADDRGKLDRWIISSETTAALLSDSTKLTAQSTSKLGYRLYDDPTEVGHIDAWMHAVNAQLLQSTIGKRAVEYMATTGDAEKATTLLARWATNTPEGRNIMGRLQWTWADKREGAREVIGYVNHYLPSRELQKKALENGRLKQADLESALPNVEDRPPVHGEALAIATGRGSVIGQRINNVFQSVLRWASDATEDQLARHPMYAAVYEQEAKRRAEYLLADPRISHVTGGDIQRMVSDQAHKKARQAVKNYMFDVAATSDLSHFMRFASPFIAAWEDTVRKWGRIAVENPDLPGKAYLLWNAPNDMGLVVDKDGNPVEQDSFTDNTYIVFPRGITKHLPGGADSEFKISKQAFNLVLQGGLQPGFGPLVAYPVGKIQTAAPQLEQIAKIVNPYGPPESFYDAVAPSTVKALTDATNEQSRNHQRDTRQIYAQLLTEYRLDPQKFGGKEPTIEDAAQRAGALGRLKILNRVANPFPFIFQSPYQMYIDAYRTLKERERVEGHPFGWADDTFMKDPGLGGSYFTLVQSESKNNAGLGSSAESVDAYNQYKSLVNKYGVEAGQAKPNLVRLIIGQEGEGAFNESAHQWQEQHEISPASGLKFRSYENPQEAQADADADLGWYKYRQFMNTVDALALERGLRTYAEDPELTETRRQFIENLQAENNAWHVEWSQRDSDAFERDLASLGEIATSGRFGPMRTDMAGVQQYLALRQGLIDQLTELEISPGSQDAQPFRQEFTDAVQGLVSQNSQFAEWSYYTFLERDPLLEPVAPAPTDLANIDWGLVNGVA